MRDFLVLIETYWNVNPLYLLDSRGSDRVLIETYWNVNKRDQKLSGDNLGCINRNILECKCGKGTFQYQPGVRINRNILECKFISPEMLSGRDLVLIETYWNVNAHGMECMGTHPGINRNILECKFCVQRCGCYHF